MKQATSTKQNKKKKSVRRKPSNQYPRTQAKKSPTMRKNKKKTPTRDAKMETDDVDEDAESEEGGAICLR